MVALKATGYVRLIPSNRDKLFYCQKIPGTFGELNKLHVCPRSPLNTCPSTTQSSRRLACLSATHRVVDSQSCRQVELKFYLLWTGRRGRACNIEFLSLWRVKSYLIPFCIGKICYETNFICHECFGHNHFSAGFLYPTQHVI